MVLQSVAEHYRRAGWTVLNRPSVGADAPFFRPDLLVQRKGRAQAVLVRGDPPGPFEIGQFAAQCKRHGIPGVLVCPLDPGVQEACDLHGLAALEVESFYGAPPVPVVTPTAPPVAPPPQVAAPLPAASAPRGAVQPARVAGWRWAIVAAIWLAAVAASARWLTLVLG